MSQLYSVTVQAPAKLNLSLDVVGLLPGGYHSLDMIMQAVTLYERVELHRSAQLTLTLPAALVSAGADNTALKAARAFFDYTGLEGGADILVYKSVPVRAGMAGGQRRCRRCAGGSEYAVRCKAFLQRTLRSGGGDRGGCALCPDGRHLRVQGVGDLIRALPPCPDCWFTVVMPGYGVSTPEAFAAYLPHRCIPSAGLRRQETAVRAGSLEALCAAAGNALEECSGAPDNEAIKALLRQQGAQAALMTGSGAAVFGVFTQEQAARAAAAAARTRWPQAYVVRPDRAAPGSAAGNNSNRITLLSFGQNSR